MQVVPALVGLALVVGSIPVGAQDSLSGHLSNGGVLRASATVDSVFVDRALAVARIEAGDWASYLLARLGATRIYDSVAVLVVIDSNHIEVRGRLQDLPPEARGALGSLASMVDSTTELAADVLMSRTGPEVVRFWLRGLRLNHFAFPEFLLGPMMAEVGRRYPALTASGRDLYVQVPADGTISLVPGAVVVGAPPRAARPPPSGSRVP